MSERGTPTPRTDKLFDQVSDREQPDGGRWGDTPSKWSYEAVLDLTDFARTLERELSACQRECEEQARLNGAGSSREAALLARLAEARRRVVEECARVCDEVQKKSYLCVAQHCATLIRALAAPQQSEQINAEGQAPCYSEVKPEAIEVGRVSSDRLNSVPPTPAVNKRTGEDLGQDDHRVPAQPAPSAPDSVEVPRELLILWHRVMLQNISYEVLSVSTNGDTLTVSAQGTVKGSAAWRRMSRISIEIPDAATTRKAFHVGRLFDIDVRLK